MRTQVKICAAFVLLAVISSAEKGKKRTRRAALFREAVDAEFGKVPESFLLRTELNKIDSIGLDNPLAQRISQALVNTPLPERTSPGGGFGPSGSYGYGPSSSSYFPDHVEEYYEPYKPVGPILLDKRPHEVTEIKSLPVSTHQTYTDFDCRNAPYQDRHYADPDAGCTIYHYCHSNGKQDTFHCAKGTTFNEYLGTCDHSEAVYCKGGEGYAGPPAHHSQGGYHESPANTYHDDGYYEVDDRASYRSLPDRYEEPSYAVHSAPRPRSSYRGRRPSSSSSRGGNYHVDSRHTPGFGATFDFGRNFGAPFRK